MTDGRKDGVGRSSESEDKKNNVTGVLKGN